MSQHHVARAGIVAVAAAMLTSILVPVANAQPVEEVRGTETVKQWYEAGNTFISQSKRLRNNERKAKNVILFVGDGMGVSTVTAARILEGQMKGNKGEENRLFFEKLPYTALSKTYSWDQQTSDSAPTMTAMVTGYKAREGMLSVDHTTLRGECNASVIADKSLDTILELAAKSGRDTGVVSTARITHATPAANYAHTPVRDWEATVPSGCGVKDIAAQLIELSPTVKKSLKVVLGGGRRFFLPNTVQDPESGANGLRTDGRNLLDEWVNTSGRPGAKYVWNRNDFLAATPSNTKYLLGLFEPDHMQYEADRNAAAEPSLTELTKKAIEMVRQNSKGFYLHVESGRIDHAHHAGNAKKALLDTIEFAKAIEMAYKMTDPDNTLILVTADHSHVFTIAGYPHRGNNILGLVKSVPNVDGNPVVPTIAGDGKPYTTLGYGNGPGWAATRADLTGVDTTALGYLQQATVPLGSETHAGEDVAIYASGPMAHLVHGSMEQNWIFHVMYEAFGFDSWKGSWNRWGHWRWFN